MNQREPSPLAVIKELFAFMTALCEDANDLALQGQAEDDVEQITSLSNRLREAGHRLTVLSQAVNAITERA